MMTTLPLWKDWAKDASRLRGKYRQRARFVRLLLRAYVYGRHFGGCAALAALAAHGIPGPPPGPGLYAVEYQFTGEVAVLWSDGAQAIILGERRSWSAENLRAIARHLPLNAFAAETASRLERERDGALRLADQTARRCNAALARKDAVLLEAERARDEARAEVQRLQQRVAGLEQPDRRLRPHPARPAGPGRRR